MEPPSSTRYFYEDEIRSAGCVSMTNEYSKTYLGGAEVRESEHVLPFLPRTLSSLTSLLVCLFHLNQKFTQ